jgi:serine/threonine protein phosphatase 1
MTNSELKNTKKIYLAIGDVHGCWVELEQMLSTLAAKFDLESPETELVFLGDYIDRGDSSLRVLQRLVALKERLPKTIFLTGNHERMFINHPNYNFENDLPKDLEPNLLSFIKELPYYHQADGFLFVHGGPMNSTEDLASMDQEAILWNYEPHLAGWRNHVVVRGHYRVKDVFRVHNLISVDTGCCFGGKLSCAVLHPVDGLIGVISIPRGVYPTK